ncbi:MAG: hypothetical protein GX868_02665 [Actinobacteria bacterium]|nr:hypothetical protein [Actinomycetota bacterium]
MSDVQFVELLIPAESRFVAKARRFIAEAASQAGWMDQERIDDLRLVASETVTNALLAQRRAGQQARISVRCYVHADRFEFSVSDQAGGFERPEQLDVHADEALCREGGFGLPLIEALSDEAHFVNTDGGTTVRLVVYRGDGVRSTA